MKRVHDLSLKMRDLASEETYHRSRNNRYFGSLRGGRAYRTRTSKDKDPYLKVSMGLSNQDPYSSQLVEVEEIPLSVWAKQLAMLSFRLAMKCHKCSRCCAFCISRFSHS